MHAPFSHRWFGAVAGDALGVGPAHPAHVVVRVADLAGGALGGLRQLPGMQLPFTHRCAAPNAATQARVVRAGNAGERRGVAQPPAAAIARRPAVARDAQVADAQVVRAVARHALRVGVAVRAGERRRADLAGRAVGWRCGTRPARSRPRCRGGRRRTPTRRRRRRCSSMHVFATQILPLLQSVAVWQLPAMHAPFTQTWSGAVAPTGRRCRSCTARRRSRVQIWPVAQSVAAWQLPVMHAPPTQILPGCRSSRRPGRDRSYSRCRSDRCCSRRSCGSRR